MATEMEITMVKAKVQAQELTLAKAKVQAQPLPLARAREQVTILQPLEVVKLIMVSGNPMEGSSSTRVLLPGQAT